MRLNVGLYGRNGHQIQRHLDDHPRARLAAVAEFPETALSEAQQADTSIRRHADLDALLADPEVQFISFCSPRRAEQAGHVLRALEAGKHVYAEKPSAFSEAMLDRILATAAAHGVVFHEMAGSAFYGPYYRMRQLVQSGAVGDVVQVVAQKSYPYFDGRPQDEDIDGGLTMQAGIHAYRWVEHVAGCRIVSVEAVQTHHGSPRAGHLQMAASVLCTLENGGIATCSSNYLNPHAATGVWGYESLVIFGTDGLLATTPGGTELRLMKGDSVERVDFSGPTPDYFDMIVDQILDGTPFPFSVEDELHPLRIAIRARAAAQAKG